MGLATIAAYRVVLFPDSKLAQAWEEKIALVWLTGTYCVKLGRCEGSTGIFFFFFRGYFVPEGSLQVFAHSNRSLICFTLIHTHVRQF